MLGVVGVAFRSTRLLTRAGLTAIALLSLAFVASTPAATDPNVGYDISYPQCNGTFPSGGAFGIVGVNAGLPFSANPCVGTGDGPSELSWAGMNAQLYANTADPGPALSSHWPNGQTSPKQCNTAANPGSNTPECHYDYGWNAALDSYRDAVNAYIALGWAATGATRTPVANQWWLDVETANSWTSTASLNVQALQGEADYLASVGAAGVGFYSSSGDWQTITAGTTFTSNPTWLAGASSPSDAQSRCGGGGFTGGGIALVQYPSGGFDADYRCGSASQLTLSFASAAQTLGAGSTSGPITVQLSQPASTSVTISVVSSSAAGTFSTSTAGPSTTLSLTVAPGATSGGSFYYEDTQAGSPTLTASASGYSSATQTETVTPAALAAISVSPATAQVRIGATRAFSAAGRDAYGNPVSVTPSWSSSLGTFSPNPGNPTTFSAGTAGTGTITASAGGIAGTASISVTKRRHPGAASARLNVSKGLAIARAGVHLQPSVAAPGSRVRVFGNAGRCPRGEEVFVLSHVFAGRSFAGLGAITARARLHGIFFAAGQLRPNAQPGRYSVSLRCGGKLRASAQVVVN